MNTTFESQFRKDLTQEDTILNPASREMISDSVELWDTEVCFLHIQFTGTNVRLPNKQKIPPEVDLESSRSAAKSESWNNPNWQCFAVSPTWQHCRLSWTWWMCEISLAKRLSHVWVHFVTARANLLTYHKMSVWGLWNEYGRLYFHKRKQT